MSPKDLRLFHSPRERLRLTIGDEKSYINVVPAWAAPLTHAGRYLGLLDEKGQEIAMVEDPRQLDETSQKAIEEELRRRYLAPQIVRIDNARVEFGATYWHVETDRGPRDFVTQSLQENAQWLGESRLLLVDVDQNRFEIPDVRKLDLKSRTFIDAIL